jgi:hypothetical protein
MFILGNAHLHYIIIGNANQEWSLMLKVCLMRVFIIFSWLSSPKYIVLQCACIDDANYEDGDVIGMPLLPLQHVVLKEDVVPSVEMLLK